MILNRQRRVRIPVAELNRFLGAAQRRLRVPAGAVSMENCAASSLLFF